MPSTHTGGHGSAPRVPLVKRAALLTLYWHAGMSYGKVADTLGLQKSTVEDIISKAKVQFP